MTDRPAPDISIIVAAYNAAQTLERAVVSAQSQEGVTLEVIIVDDGSTDDTHQVAQALAAGDDRVRAIHLPVNQGPSAARNAGIAQARGAWVTPLDADDVYRPGRLRLLLAEGIATGADLIADNIMRCDLDLCPQDRLYDGDVLTARSPLTVAGFLDANRTGGGETSYGYMKPLIRRSFLQAHDLRYADAILCAEDWLLYLSCLFHGARFHLLPDAYYLYATYRGSTSRQRANMVRNEEHLVAAVTEGLHLAQKFNDPVAVDALRKQLPRLKRYLMRQRVKKVLLDRPWIAALTDRIKGAAPS